MQLENLRTKIIGKQILLLEEVDSTNTEARRLALSGHGEGTVVVSTSQLHGKGRQGRRWVSPQGGIYLSILLKPYINQSRMPLLTILASVAAVRTIRGLTRLDVGVKWPNDIVICGKKLGGILCEASKNVVIVGIGLNLNTNLSLFPVSLKKQVTSVKFEMGNAIKSERVFKILLEEFDELYGDFLHRRTADIVEEWANSCQTLGQKVKIETGAGNFCGIAEKIGGRGELRLRTFDGKIRKIFPEDAIKVHTEGT